MLVNMLAFRGYRRSEKKGQIQRDLMFDIERKKLGKQIQH